MLHGMDTDMIGDFHNGNEQQDLRLENFIVPPNSLLPRKTSRSKDGKGEMAQSTLTDRVIHDSQFHLTFDKFKNINTMPREGTTAATAAEETAGADADNSPGSNGKSETQLVPF